MESILSAKSKYVYNPISEEDQLAEKLKKKGKEIISLSAGDPAKYFETPKYFIDAYIRALKEGKTSYALGAGVKELRQAIANRYRRLYKLNADPEDVIVTQGVSEAIDFLNAIMINAPEKAILFRPYYPLYPLYLRENGGVPLFEEYYEHLGWNIDPEKLEKTIKKEARKRPKYMLITNPNNPTGTVFDRKVLEEIVDLANNYDILLVSDEIYDEIVFNNAKFTSIAKLAKGMPYIIMNGASKAFDATGFRLGYVIIPEHDSKSKAIRQAFVNYAQARLSANVPAQYAFAEALENEKEHEKNVKRMVKEIEKRANFATQLLNETPNMHAVEPNSAFYVFPKLNKDLLSIKDDKEFVIRLLNEEGIQVTRGSAFGSPDHIRVVALAPKDILSKAINKINEFCERHKRKEA
ncbi:MAG: pyridoxal phosphate-dependent aminotransferase [Candidatus Micrarchaeia archaeon]